MKIFLSYFSILKKNLVFIFEIVSNTPCSQLSYLGFWFIPRFEYLEKLFLRSNDYVLEQAELFLQRYNAIVGRKRD